MTEAERHSYDRSSKWLIQHHGPAKLAERCRDIIEQRAAPEERENLFAVVQVLARLRYNEPEVFAILGGKQSMIVSPLIQEIVAEALHEAILRFLKGRFGEIPPDFENQIRSVSDPARLNELSRVAGSCSNLEDFRRALN